jgi:hypothetical protein
MDLFGEVNDFVLNNYHRHDYFSTHNLVRDYVQSKGINVRGYDKKVLVNLAHKASNAVRSLLLTGKIEKYNSCQYRVIK